MDTLEAITTVMNRINFETNEFAMPADTFERMRIQMAVAHIQEDSARVKLFEDMVLDKRKDFFTNNKVIQEQDLGGTNEATRESQATGIEDSGTNEVSTEHGARNQVAESDT